MVGCAALEIYTGGALLRSVVIDNSVRTRGIGTQLVTAALELARVRGAPAVYLLTTTARGSSQGSGSCGSRGPRFR